MPAMAPCDAPAHRGNAPASPNRTIQNRTAGRRVFLPREHGSWSLVLEPLLLGLLVAPSWQGGALGLAAFAGFLARQPLKAATAAADVRQRKIAREVLAMLSALAIAGLFEAITLGTISALWPLLIAVPFGVLFLHYDAQGEWRSAEAELAGSAAFALVPAAMATLAGWSAGTALAVAAIALARSIPVILTVRAYLRLHRNENRTAADQSRHPRVQHPQQAEIRGRAGLSAESQRNALRACPSSGEAARPHAGFGLAAAPMAAAALAIIALALLAIRSVVPWMAPVCALLLFARTTWLVSPLRPAWPARRIGLFEAIVGGLWVIAIAAGYRLAS